MGMAVFSGVSTLGPADVRVLGSLLEKQRTTPDAYPLSLNALRLACNQSTNRDPVVDYEDALIRESLHRLERRGLVRLASGRGSRAAKYRHLLAEALPMSDAEQATMAVLMLRGAQTPGELKQRTERMHAFAHLEDVSATLARLIERGLVQRLPRRPGQKEERYEQLLDGPSGSDPYAAQGPPVEADRAEPPAGGGTPAVGPAEHAVAPAEHAVASAQHAVVAHEGPAPALDERVARLEREVAELRARVGLEARA